MPLGRRREGEESAPRLVTAGRIQGCTVRVMSFPVFSARLQTEKLPQTLVRSAILLLLIASGAFSQPTQPLSEADRVADMKQRVVQVLHLRAGDTAADVGCGDGFYKIPLARFLGPAGKGV